MEFVFSPQGLAVDISNGILKSDDAGFLYCSKIETSDILNNSITSDKLDSNITLSGLSVNVITGSSIYSDTITCNNLYVNNGQLTQQGSSTGPTGPIGLQGETGPIGATGATGPQGLPGIGITGTFISGSNITANNIYATTITTTTDSFVNSIRMGQGTVTGSQNTAFGINALDSVIGTIGSNTAVGYNSLTSNTSGYDNTSIGSHALSYNISGNFNTAVGVESQLCNIDGLQNVSLGRASLYANENGDNNVAIGNDSLFYNKANANIAVGVGSMYYNTVGYGNVAVGHGSGSSLGNTGSINCIYIGLNANSGNANYTNSTAIGANSVITASNQIVLGNSSVTQITTSGSISVSSVIAEVALYSATPSITLTTQSPQNIIITNTTGTTITLPNSPINGTSFEITRFTNFTVVINRSGTNTIQNLPRPRTTVSNTTKPALATSISMFVTSPDSSGWFFGIWGITIVYNSGVWYVTNQTII
jgi:hypothetical protein